MSDRQSVQKPDDAGRIGQSDSNQSQQSSDVPAAGPVHLPPAKPMFRRMRQNAILRIQQTQGNQAVLRHLAASIPDNRARVQRDSGIRGQVDPTSTGRSSQNTQSSSMPHQGQPATAKGLQEDLQIEILDWKVDTLEGLREFYNEEFAEISNNRADPVGFFSSFFGNALWALAVFLPPMASFLVSLYAIQATTFGPAIGAKRANDARASATRLLGNTDQYYASYIEAVYKGLRASILPRANYVVNFYPSDDHWAALERIMTNWFRPEFLEAGINPDRTTDIKGDAVKQAIKQRASDYMGRYKDQIISTMPSEAHSNEEYLTQRIRIRGLSIIQVRPMNRLALVDISLGRYIFKQWISPDLTDTALKLAEKQWQDAGSWYDPARGRVEWDESQPLPSLYESDIDKSALFYLPTSPQSDSFLK